MVIKNFVQGVAKVYHTICGLGNFPSNRHYLRKLTSIRLYNTVLLNEFVFLSIYRSSSSYDKTVINEQ